ncbi:MAG: calcium-translocating P-type ATPase, SERCA-type [Euryarchaeota archaeon]|nr:calcium-translocating P-type ATPase, SERCA-type [Euryarchaeota archaeon]
MHTKSINDVFKKLQSERKGLTEDEAGKRLEKHGYNELEEGTKISALTIFLSQFKDFLMVILSIAIIVSLAIGETADALVIFIILIASAILGFVQEYRAEKSLEMLKRMSSPKAKVLRNGKEIEIETQKLVPGDLIILKTGDKVPADCRVITSYNLNIDEAALTGESTTVLKTTEILPENTPLAERKNLVFSGTIVTFGRGTCIVYATGMNTEFGKIAEMLKDVKREMTPLQKNLEDVGKVLGMASLIICFIVAALGILRGYKPVDMFIWGVSLAVAAVPEALPAVVTITLAVGVQKMVKQHAIIRKLPAVETLGCATVICTDKTGTLTKNEMTVKKVFFNEKTIQVSGVGYSPMGSFFIEKNEIERSSLELVGKISALCNDAELVHGKEYTIMGDPTEGALVVLAEKIGLKKSELEKAYPRKDESSFTSERKMMSVLNDKIYAKGAPEIILEKCSYIYTNGVREITEIDKKRVLEMNEKFASEGLRVLALAYKESDSLKEEDLVFVSLTAMLDPPREEAERAITLCGESGIEVVMITGDQKSTAKAIAKELKILKEGDMVLAGRELDEISDEAFEEMVENVKVYARVSPQHKMKIIDAFKKRGDVVAMTGDGINDAPALKNANIGIAMGITGTDVSKESADMILTDDNFASIEAAVEEGRGIYDNIKKYLAHLLSGNVGEILIMTLAVLMDMGLPLVAIQLLFLNLFTDGLPAIALSVEPKEPNIMKRKPRDIGKSIFKGRISSLILGVGIYETIVIIPIFWFIKNDTGLIEAQTMAFTLLTMIEIFNSFNCKSMRHSIFELGIFNNFYLIGAFLSSFGMQLAVIYVPFLQKYVHTTALGLEHWVIIALASFGVIAIVETAKYLFKDKK